MKCPKCGYLGFEKSDRCRNCGYDFSFSEAFEQGPDTGMPAKPPSVDFALESEVEYPRRLDLDRIIGAPDRLDAPLDLPLFGGRDTDDAPLISTPSRPRAPLGVRRPTTEVPRARTPMPKMAAQSEGMLFEMPPAAVIGRTFTPTHSTDATGDSLAAPSRRILAALVDVSLLCVLDAGVVYFTLRLLGLSMAEMLQLPVLPLSAFFLLLNGGYFIAFTAVGGQSIGKMAAGIKVITQEDSSVPIGRATVRTLAYLVSALPLGAGFLPGVMSADRLALHDRLAHTRVVRPSYR
jgi:uncharacterized RDD family membrane protein YckC